MAYRSRTPGPPIGEFVESIWLYGDSPSHPW
jgi:hypothetical protein